MIPTHLPTLSKGAHDPADGKACVMEYVSLLAGESWSDNPSCTHPVLASMARSVNDRMADEDRHLLVPLIGRLFGTSESGTPHERHVLSVRLGVWCARRVQGLSTDPRVEAAIAAAEGWCDGQVGAEECRAAAYAAYAAANAAANAAAYAAYAAYAYAAYAYAANAAAYAAYAADAAADLPGLLTGLLGEYDRLTGRTEHHEVTDAELATLAAAVTN